jgi:hypothetical protein
MRYAVWAIVAIIGCLLTACGIQGGAAAGSFRVTARERAIVTVVERRAGFEFQLPTWLPAGWRITRSYSLDTEWANEWLVVKGHHRTIRLWEEWTLPNDPPMSSPKLYAPVPHPVRQWHRGRRFVQEILSRGLGREVSVVVTGSHYSLGISGALHGVPWSTLTHIAASTLLPVTDHFTRVYVCHPGPHCNAAFDGYWRPRGPLR